MQLKYKFGLA